MRNDISLPRAVTGDKLLAVLRQAAGNHGWQYRMTEFPSTVASQPETLEVLISYYERPNVLGDTRGEMRIVVDPMLTYFKVSANTSAIARDGTMYDWKPATLDSFVSSLHSAIHGTQYKPSNVDARHYSIQVTADAGFERVKS